MIDENPFRYWFTDGTGTIELDFQTGDAPAVDTDFTVTGVVQTGNSSTYVIVMSWS